MRRRRRIVLIAVCVTLVVAALIAILRTPPEPSFQGRRLSAWVEDINPAPLGGNARMGPVTFMPGGRVVNTGGGTFIVQPTNVLTRFVWMPSILTQQNPQHTAAAQAIREIGTNAIPYLLRTIYSQDPSWK